MKVFVTGASGWIGSAVVPELLAAGHQVTGLARSDASAARLEASGVEVLRGDLDTLEVIRDGSLAADAVIHLANKHDFANPAVSNAAERAAVDTIGSALLGTDKPFLFAAGTAIAPGTVVTEETVNPGVGPDAPRGGSEALAMDYAERGVHAVSLRFAPTVHGQGDHGFIRIIADASRRAGFAPYVAEGANAWSAVGRADAARLVARALESAPAGTAVHAVGEERVATRDIAEAVAERLGIEARSVSAEEAVEAIGGFIGTLFGWDLPASNAITRARYDWEPAAPTLLDDIRSGFYTD
ncbi:nucleoside-diphosphate-sugar epimerase [Nocardioides sp. BE266]|uniref:SDR family oxidoreductase n=1 Tax=Nocardioides sp. BE266 TaxID=2817725 RepID=UPI00285C2915|nr:SDR family oxidoreductase [Nocardioides sp. BE266]MDR7253254.1 nucleoside-diphosphate-sugar epimerase [Nocardioides sp. BE266]